MYPQTGTLTTEGMYYVWRSIAGLWRLFSRKIIYCSQRSRNRYALPSCLLHAEPGRSSRLLAVASNIAGQVAADDQPGWATAVVAAGIRPRGWRVRASDSM